jgi:hypothetical protein
MKTDQVKQLHFNKIQRIIYSCRTAEQAENTRVILNNFFRLHNDTELYSKLYIQLTLKLGNVSDTLYFCEQKIESKSIDIMKSLKNLFTLKNYKYIAGKN